MLVFLLIVIVVVLFNTLIIYLAMSAKNWSHVTGKVVSIKLKKSTIPTKKPGGPIAMSLFLPLIVYEYEVNGRKYFNKRIYFGLIDAQFPDERSAYEVLGAEKAGDPVDVYYWSLLKSLSVLRPDLSSVGSNVIIIVIVCTVYGAVSYLLK